MAHFHTATALSQLATYAAFRRMPEEVWAWYLYRRGVCRAARPNAAHLALAALEKALGDRFVLVTQNVDGLHLRAGNTAPRTYQIHGNIDFLRCEDEHPRLRPVPESLPLDWPKARRLSDPETRALRCCGGDAWSRPHVLWFDDSYDEELFRFESTLGASGCSVNASFRPLMAPRRSPAAMRAWPSAIATPCE